MHLLGQVITHSVLQHPADLAVDLLRLLLRAVSAVGTRQGEPFAVLTRLRGVDDLAVPEEGLVGLELDDGLAGQLDVEVVQDGVGP